MKRAIVIGAGIAGPVAAVGLQAAGWEPVVYEAYAEGAALTAGSWLTLAANGVEALRTFGLHEAVLAAGFPSTEIALCSGTGKRLGVAPLGGRGEASVTQTVRRADLFRALYEGARARGVPFVHGKRLVAVETPGDEVVARFADGSEAVGDVLVGADGVHSVVRGLLDARAPAPRLTGMGNVGGFAPGGAIDAKPGEYRMIFGKRAFFGYVAHPAGEVWWFANPPYPFPEGADAGWLADLFAEDVGPAAELVRATTHPLGFHGQYELPRVPTWRKGRVVLLGDAAHAASPTSGQGASLAAEDAVALAWCLRDLPVPEALATYERLRRDRCERVVREAARMSAHKVPGPMGRFARDLVLPYVLARATADPRDWLFTYRVEWERKVEE